MSYQYQPDGSGSSDPYGYGSPAAGGAPTPYSSPAAGDPYAHQPAGAGYDSTGYGSDSYAGTGYDSTGYGSPQSYAQPAYVQAPPQNTLALLSLIMSLVGLATSGLTAIAGIILGHIAKSQIKRTGETGDNLATWGLIVGYVIVGLAVLFWVAYFVFIFLIIGAGVMSSS
ncbi:DUF4190 domain-containing protein [Brevibacterium luteolum]|uniref:DUF4190 domain-containing protein n=1 Tax=Brevibacterium luteolum TaxID=199591 RepID=UPI00223BBC4B|nr:DUF4190 domain-containing protein [Brevibacterium luteolum]MCT1874401.1 DUF4190 domain-containing protein [Brevibacterium luteolum]MCT1891603.1 DUF4190 domain-containing protein [Brevibacterium luteolum]MCT1894034.1 DUF4190 domain-containing protein [Brevibacterium luteolum]MCT1924531.1 DUF4190 domain-containing protein [Brevibacterium luteolum]